MPKADHIQQETFGKMPDGREVLIFTLTNKHGLRARVTEFGASLVSMEVPDKSGALADITHGYETLDGWRSNNAYLGASVGRFANRIKDGKFTLDGKEYTLATNNEPGGMPSHLHGGNIGFDKVVWTGKATDTGVEFTYLSKDGEEGYPGNLTSFVTYTLTDDNELIWEARATTDAPTIVNLVHHTYWNLSGNPKSTINDHELTLHADHYLPTNAGLIPTGEIAPVVGTPMDFVSQPAIIGSRLNADFEALAFAGGYDHCWVLKEAEGLKPAARLKDPKTGRVMEISTDQPAIQFYGGNFLDGTIIGKQGIAYTHRTALCLETQKHPDAPNHEHFPNSILRPGEIYQHRMIHRFLAE